MINLANKLENTLGRPKHYVEIACPFSGLLLATAHSTELRKWRAITSPSTRSDSRKAEIARLQNIFERVGLRFVGMMVTVWRCYARLLGITKSTDRLFTGKRTFAVVPSLRRWGLSCIQFGFGCSQVALQALTCELAFLDDLAPDAADICGVFNSIDHVEEPANLLKRCLEIAPNVVVSGHKQRSGFQHGYGLDIDTFRFLGAKYSFAVTDLSKQIDDWPSQEYLVLLNRK
jgi:hypothetical protein